MRNLLTALTLFATLCSSTASELLLEQIRSDMASIISNKNKMITYISRLDKSGEPSEMDYRGMLKTCFARFCFLPTQKLKWFMDGRNDIEEAIKQFPSSAEIHFIRLLVQQNCPSFLFYKTNIEEDKSILLACERNGCLPGELEKLIRHTMPELLN